MKVRRIVRISVLGLCLLVLLISGYHVIDYWQKGKVSRSLNDSIRDKVVSAVTEPQPDESLQPEATPITVDFEVFRQKMWTSLDGSTAPTPR